MTNEDRLLIAADACVYEALLLTAEEGRDWRFAADAQQAMHSASWRIPLAEWTPRLEERYRDAYEAVNGALLFSHQRAAARVAVVNAERVRADACDLAAAIVATAAR